MVELHKMKWPQNWEATERGAAPQKPRLERHDPDGGCELRVRAALLTREPQMTSPYRPAGFASSRRQDRRRCTRRQAEIHGGAIKPVPPIRSRQVALRSMVLLRAPHQSQSNPRRWPRTLHSVRARLSPPAGRPGEGAAPPTPAEGTEKR